MADDKSKGRDVIVIHIDKKEYRSPSPTTGTALYALGGVNPDGYDLFEEVQGSGDDRLIPNDGTEIELRDGEHFYSVQKHITPGARQ
jgi:hypothetical protein